MTTPSAPRPVQTEARRLTAAEVFARPTIIGPTLGPDGRTIAYTHIRDRRAEEDTGAKRIMETSVGDVVLLPSEGGFPQPFTNSGDVSQPPVWSPDGTHLLVERQGQLQLLAVNPEGVEKPLVLFRGALYRPSTPAGDTPFSSPCWSPDGRWLLIATRQEPETTLTLLSSNGRQRRDLLTLDGYLLSWDWSPDSRSVVVVTQSENAHVGDVRLVSVETGEAATLWQETSYAYQKPVAAFSPQATGSPAGTRIVFRSNRSGWAKLYSAAPDGSDIHPLTTGAWDDYAFRLSPNGRHVAFASRAAQQGTGDDLWVVPLSGGDPVRLTHRSGVAYPVAWSPTGRLFAWLSGPTEPGDLWTIDDPASSRPTPQNEPRRLTHSVPAELSRKLPPSREVTFTTPDGTLVSALIYLPAGHQEGEKHPPIVWIRGGPTAFSRNTFSATSCWLANEGFVVITLNYRGSTGHGVDFMESVAGEGVGKHDLHDVLATAEFVKTLPETDTTRGVGIGGHSWGGYLTLMAVTLAPDTFACAVASAAVADWHVQQSQTEVRWYDRWLVGGWLYERDAHAKDRSPISHAEKLKTPLLVLHGEQDKDVPFAQIGPFVDRAKKSGAPVDFVTFPNEGHGNRLPSHQQDWLNHISSFFRRHLQPWNFRDNPSSGQVP